MSGSLQPANYCTHAIEDLSALAANLERQGLTDGPVSKNEIGTLRIFTRLLRESQKFLIPDGGRLLDLKQTKTHFQDLLHLPFPIVALEFNTDDASSSGVQKNIVLAWSGAELFGIEHAPTYDPHAAPPICFTRLIYAESFKRWMVTPHLYWFHREHFIEQIEAGNRWNANVGMPFPTIFPDARRDNYNAHRDPSFQRAAWALIEFCLTINCENVAQAEIPAPAALNKKRAAKDREPFYSYRVLTIPGHGGGSEGNGGGSHASPRMHLRRGHLRRLASGKVTWVRHAMVGNAEKGVVDKTYAVETPAARA